MAVTGDLISGVYVLASATLVVAGLTLVAFATRAYFETEHASMLHLSVGFTLVVAAAIATSVAAFLTGFRSGLSLLTTNYAITTVGYLFVIYSVVKD